mgnify:FL=1
MARFLPLVPLLLWLIWSQSRPETRPLAPVSLILFGGGFVLAILLLAILARRTVRAGPDMLHRRIDRFQRLVFFARIGLIAWWGYGLWHLDWGLATREITRFASGWPIDGPAVLVATLPAYLAWLALAWAQYPVERRWREQNLMIRFDQLQPLHPAPTLREHLSQTLRLQLLFTLAPIAMVILLRDTFSLIAFGRYDLQHVSTQLLISGLSVLIVFILAPEILLRVLPTQPLPPGPLRDRLERFCRRAGLRYRDIRLWNTHHTMSNAAVMGVVPQVRYSLLSDMRIETLTARQIEAVFAHEAGHVRHRHMVWYFLFIIAGVLLLDGPGVWLAGRLDALMPRSLMIWEWIFSVGGLVALLVVFGAISRRCERQADVFAARAIEPDDPIDPPLASDASAPIPGEYGAEVFAQTLRRVAEVNGMPLDGRPRTGRLVPDLITWLQDHAGHFLHGTIAQRMNFVRDLARSPEKSHAFDRSMRVIFTSIGLLLVAGIAAMMV